MMFGFQAFSPSLAGTLSVGLLLTSLGGNDKVEVVPVSIGGIVRANGPAGALIGQDTKRTRFSSATGQ